MGFSLGCSISDVRAFVKSLNLINIGVVLVVIVLVVVVGVVFV